MASIVNVTRVEGDDTPETWAITSDADPLNLSSADVVVVIKPNEHYEDDDEAAYRLTEGAGVTIVDAAAGTVRAELPDAVIEAPSRWLYKVIVTSAGQTATAIWGNLWIADA